MKITEELKFEDIVMKQIQNPPRKGGKNFDRSKGYQKQSSDKEKDDESKREEGETKMEEDVQPKKEEDELKKEEGDESKEEGDVQVKTETKEIKMEVDEVKTEAAEQNVEGTEEKAEDDKKESNGSPAEGDAEDSKNKDDVEVPIEAPPTHLFRVGWSVVDAGLQLGETTNSFGYESSAKFVTNKEFVDYGVQFGVGDVVTAYVVST